MKGQTTMKTGYCALIKTLFLPALIHFASSAGFAEDAKFPPLEIGSLAPDFSLPGVDGRTYTLQDFADAKILVMVFTCNHCPTAQAYEERIQKIADDYRERGVALVAVSPNSPEAVMLTELGYSDMGDSLEDMKIRARDHKFTFPYLYDGETQEMSRAYGPKATPHVFIFDSERKLRYMGRIDDNEHIGKEKIHDTRNAIEALLAEQPVPVETTKTFGCSVKWAEKSNYRETLKKQWAAEEVELGKVDAKGVKALVGNDSGKLRLINVWATWCGPCVIEFPDLVDINRMYRARDFEMVTLSADAPNKADKALEFLKDQQASCSNYILDSEDRYAFVEAVDSEWSGALPYTMLVKPDGEVLYRREGLIDPLELKRAIVGWVGRYYE
jgi:peroxiredoxin